MRADFGGAATSRARLSRLLGVVRLVFPMALNASKPRRNAPSRRRQDLRLGQIHPRQQARSEADAKTRPETAPVLHPNIRGSRYYHEGDANLLKHPTLDQLHALGLYGMAKAIVELSQSDEAKSRPQRLARSAARSRSLATARKAADGAAARRQAPPAGESRRRRLPRRARARSRVVQTLAEGKWIDDHDNLAFVGQSGTGKSWLACAIGQKACRDNRSVVYHRWPKLCEDLALARGDGRHLAC